MRQRHEALPKAGKPARSGFLGSNVLPLACGNLKERVTGGHLYQLRIHRNWRELNLLNPFARIRYFVKFSKSRI
jgi:hypothetical protein